jgi:hypothetical protein
MLARPEDSLLTVAVTVSAWARALKLMNNPVSAKATACFDFFI